MTTIIAGGGAIGSRLAVRLSQRGEDVTVVEQDKKRCQWISKNSDAKVYNGSSLDPELLMQAGIDKANTLIVAMGNDRLTGKVVDFAKKQFGVPKIFAVTKEPGYTDKTKASGANAVICSQDEVMDEIENALDSGPNRVLYHDAQRSYLISGVTLRATSNTIGKEVGKLQNKSARISGMMRNGALMFPLDDTVLQMGDELFIMGLEDEVEKLVSEIGRES